MLDFIWSGLGSAGKTQDSKTATKYNDCTNPIISSTVTRNPPKITQHSRRPSNPQTSCCFYPQKGSIADGIFNGIFFSPATTLKAPTYFTENGTTLKPHEIDSTHKIIPSTILYIDQNPNVRYEYNFKKPNSGSIIIHC